MTTMVQIQISYGEQRNNDQIVKENNRVNEKLREMNDANFTMDKGDYKFKMQRAVTVSTPLYIILTDS
jgi:hypothetical protein